MDAWLKTCLLLCLYGFFKELRPSEFFLTEYLVQPPMNLTYDELIYEVYPVWTYSYLSLLIVVFLLTDMLRYKPVIVLEGIGYVVTWCLLLWARGVPAMQFMEFMYGIATSTEVAYYTYIYAKVANKFYQRVTSYTRTAILSGRFISAVLSQVLISTGLMDYRGLNYISLASVSVAFVIACCLPSVSTSVYFHRQQYHPSISEGGGQHAATQHTQLHNKEGHSRAARTADKWLIKFKTVRTMMWDDFKDAYSNRYLLKWSVWWAFATCGNYQVGNFIQLLWESIVPVGGDQHLYNGAVEATQTFLSALSAFSVGYLHLNWELLGEGTLAFISLLDGFLLLTMGLSYSIAVSYINYILFRVSYQMLITIASYQVAKGLREDSYGLVFGVNMFLSLLLQTLLTIVVVEVLQLDVHTQFIVYGVYFLVLAMAFLGLSSYSLGRLGCEGVREAGIWQPKPLKASQDPPQPPIGTTEAF